MGKKNKNKGEAKKVKVRQNLACNMLSMDEAFMNSDFESLKPTAAGANALAQIRRRKSKLTAGASNTELVATPPVPVFNLTPMSEMLDELEDAVKAGKFGKAYDGVDMKVIKEFIDHYNNLSIEDEQYKQVNGMIKKLITIGKSFYEYDEKSREVMDNVTYDSLINKFLANGNIEPAGIIPKGSKKQKRVGIKYPTLHNNMDKAYVVHVDDKIPEGVKETTSIEKWLDGVYKAIEASPEAEVELFITDKIDGVSVNATVDGDVIRGVQTRGDEDESISVMGMDGMEVSIGHDAEDTFGIQYEMFVTNEDVLKASEYLKLDRPYVSNRHAASGILHRLCTVEDDKLLEFVSLWPIATEGLDGTYKERMDYVGNFKIVPDDMRSGKYVKGSKTELLDKIQKYMDKLADKREKLSYAVDGIVITVADDDYQKNLGRNGRTNKFQIALKFDPANAKGEVDGIHLDSGKKGYRTIQVDLKHPVFLDGVKYDHVPVLSLNLFEKMGLREGSIVNVHRVGDVNPSITVIDEGKGFKIQPPKKCPVCGWHLITRNKKLYCENTECKDNLIGKFSHFFEKMGMDGYSDAFAETLVEKLKCKNFSDIVSLTSEKFKSADVTDKLAMNFKETLEKAISNHYDFEILGAMGIPGVGPARARAILAMVPFDKLPDIREMSVEVNDTMAFIANIMGSGDKPYVEFYQFDTIISDIKEILTLNPKITKDFSKVIRVGHTGGKLSDDIVKLCQDRGLTIVDSSSFDVLITTNKDRESTKMDAAKKKGLPIFLPEDFKSYYAYADFYAPVLKRIAN